MTCAVTDHYVVVWLVDDVDKDDDIVAPGFSLSTLIACQK
jgi:hypothetical protein